MLLDLLRLVRVLFLNDHRSGKRVNTHEIDTQNSHEKG